MTDRMEGRERLRVLARAMWPTTDALFTRVGMERTARCLDVGCGGGDVTVALARRAPDGAAVGIDVDETKIALARAEAADAGVDNVEFWRQDVMDPAADGEGFDVVYTRFVLTHLPDPAKALTNMRQRLHHRALLRAGLAGILALRRAVHQGGAEPGL